VKRSNALVLALVVALAGMVNAQGSSTEVDPSVTGTLVIYTTTYDIEYKLIIEQGFLGKYPNVRIETVQAGAGELKTRIRSEAENPQADVMFGGLSYADTNAGLWEPYVSTADATLPEAMRNTSGYLTWMTIQLENLLVSYDAAARAGIDPNAITGFASLLDPALDGKIIWADPSSSSSAWNMLATMLVVMGGYESEEAWDYVDRLLGNGVVIGSSSSIPFRSVFEGEYVVGLTYEAPAVSYYEAGFDEVVKIVYMEEGTSAFPFASAIVKGARNLELAQLFMDYVASDEAQTLWATSTARQANTTIPTTNAFLTDAADILIVDSDHQYLADHKDEILARFQALYAKHN
jgi:iron(III) transport system substrate-binding protein